MARSFGLGFAPDGWSGLTDAMKQKGYTERELAEAGLAKNGRRGGVYDAFRNRLMFPVIDVRGNVVAFSGRILGDGEPKYLNSPDTPDALNETAGNSMSTAATMPAQPAYGMPPMLARGATRNFSLTGVMPMALSLSAMWSANLRSLSEPGKRGPISFAAVSTMPNASSAYGLSSSLIYPPFSALGGVSFDKVSG